MEIEEVKKHLQGKFLHQQYEELYQEDGKRLYQEKQEQCLLVRDVDMTQDGSVRAAFGIGVYVDIEKDDAEELCEKGIYRHVERQENNIKMGDLLVRTFQIKIEEKQS